MSVAALTDEFVLPQGAERLLLGDIGTVKFQVDRPDKKFGLVLTENGTVYYRGDAVYRYKFNGTPNPVLVKHKKPLRTGQHVTLDVNERRSPSSQNERLYSTRVVVWEPERIEQLIEKIENLPVCRFLRITDAGEEILWVGQDLTEFQSTYPRQAFRPGMFADYRFERFDEQRGEWMESSPHQP